MTSAIVIAGAARTAIGAFNGALATQPASTLATIAIKEALARAKTGPSEVNEVVLGQILAAAQGQGPARVAAANAGVPVDRTAYAVNQICGSGLRAVAEGYKAISVLSIGHQTRPHRQRPRLPLKDLVFNEKWGEPYYKEQA